MKETSAQFNPETDELKFQYFVGNAFAHIKAVTVRDGLPLKLKGQFVEGVTQKVFQIEYMLHADTGTNEFESIEYKNGEAIKTVITGEELIKETIKNNKAWKDQGTFFCPNPPADGRWVNKRYLELCSKLGIEFPDDGKGNVQIMEIEEEDLIGLPVVVSLGIETSKDNKRYNKVLNIMPWEKGKRLTPDELFASDTEDEVDPEVGF